MSTRHITYLILFILLKFSHCSNINGFEVVSSTPSPEATQNSTLHSEIQDLAKTILSLNKRLASLESQKTKSEEKKFCPNVTLPRNCQEVFERGNRASGIYQIKPNFATKEISVLCNMKSMGGGWTYILNRYDGSQDFYQNWRSYKEGFGDLNAEFWLGLENIHLLTGYELNQLLIELVDWDGKQVSGHYDLFTIGSEREGYSLKYLQGFSGDAGDSLSHELNMKFTTKDRDQDVWAEQNCAVFSHAAWWYRDCKYGHLTGVYLGQHFDQKDKLTGIYWVTFHGNTYSLKEMRMMVRPNRPTNHNPAL